MPRSVAERLITGESRVVDHVPDSTVLFADLVGFTQIAAEFPPEQAQTSAGAKMRFAAAHQATAHVEMLPGGVEVHEWSWPVRFAATISSSVR